MDLNLYFPLLPSLVLLVAGLAAAGGGIRPLPQRSALAAAVLGMTLLSTLWIVSTAFTGTGIDESVIFHLRQGVTGAGYGEFTGLVLAAALLMLAGLALAAWALLARGRASASGRRALPALALSAAALAAHPGAWDLFALSQEAVAARAHQTAGHPPELVLAPETGAPAAGTNLIMVYLEGLEQTYLDETLFPGLMPNLSRLAARGTRHDGLAQVLGDAWTIGGMTASQCGIPLIAPSGGNSMEGVDLFLPGATCMGDLLSAIGYELEYIGGASLAFAGKGRFFETHGFTRILGREQLAHRVDEGYLTGWGLYDDSLFGIALERVGALAAAEAPFGFFMLTLDTHPPQGHPSRSCEDRPWQDGSNPMLNAVHCTDHLLGDFVAGLERMGALDDAVLVIASDHLAMQSPATELLNQGRRKNLFIEIHPERPPAVTTRVASLYDIGPTVLSSLGLDVPALGFGRDLNRPEPTLRERNPDFAAQVRAARPFLLGLWEFPSLRYGLALDPQDAALHLGERRIDLPAVLVLDDGLRVRSVHLGSRRADVLAKLPIGTGVLWADSCWRVSALNADSALSESYATCIALARLGSQTTTVLPIGQPTSLRAAAVRAALAGDGHDAALHAEQRERLSDLQAWSHWRMDAWQADAALPDGQDVVLVSSGGNRRGSSLVGSVGADGPQRLRLQRGITVLSVSAGSGVRTLKRLGHLQTPGSGAGRTAGDHRRGLRPRARHVRDVRGAGP
jgi:hypothetical protein